MNQLADSKSRKAGIPLPRGADYDADFVLWAEHQAALLRANRLDELDREHLIEELDAMSGKDRRELRSRLAVILIHLLKCRFQPERKTSSWAATPGEQRDQVAHLLEQSPSLKASLSQYMTDAYPRRSSAGPSKPAYRTQPFLRKIRSRERHCWSSTLFPHSAA